MLGLCGVAGALTASFVGSLVHKFGVRFFTFVGCSLIIAAWIIMFIFQNSYLGFIVGIIVIDIGMQCVQIGNQTCALSQAPKATNRVNTIFMTTYFVGGSLGTFLAGTFWHAWGWTGVVCVGIGLTLISLLVTHFYSKLIIQMNEYIWKKNVIYLNDWLAIHPYTTVCSSDMIFCGVGPTNFM